MITFTHFIHIYIRFLPFPLVVLGFWLVLGLGFMFASLENIRTLSQVLMGNTSPGLDNINLAYKLEHGLDVILSYLTFLSS